MKTLLVTLAALTLASCTQLNSLEITPDDNAMACLRGNTNAAGAVFGANVSGITVELPAQVDTSGWTADDWKTLAELCD
jgi:filamentous hemagglutinin family protein